MGLEVVLAAMLPEDVMLATRTDDEDVAAAELDVGLAGPATLRPATNCELGVFGVVNVTAWPLIAVFR